MAWKFHAVSSYVVLFVGFCFSQARSPCECSQKWARFPQTLLTAVLVLLLCIFRNLFYRLSTLRLAVPSCDGFWFWVCMFFAKHSSQLSFLNCIILGPVEENLRPRAAISRGDPRRCLLSSPIYNGSFAALISFVLGLDVRPRVSQTSKERPVQQ